MSVDSARDFLGKVTLKRAHEEHHTSSVAEEEKKKKK